MADVYILDKNFQIMGIIDDFASLLWNEKYYDTGSFELHCPQAQGDLLKSNTYIIRNDDQETGIIQEFEYVSDDTGKKVIAKGPFLKAILADRVIDSTQKFTNLAASEVIKSLVNRFCINPIDQKRKIPKLTIKQSEPLGAMITTQITGDGLLEAIERISLEQQLSANVTYDFINDQLLFNVWQGLDRTQSQSNNTWATFSEKFENIATTSYSRNKDYKNYAYVAGAGEGEARVIEIVDQIKVGEPRRELYVDARDLQDTDKDGVSIPEATYRQTLHQRGLEKLAQYQPKETVETTIDPTSNLVYKVDYDLGDKVTYVDDIMGIVTEQRITEIYESIESESQKVEVIFGKEQLNIMQKINKGVK